MSNYDFSEVESLFQTDSGGAGEFEQAATGGQYPDYSGMFDFGSGALSDEELGAVGNYLAQNGIDINTLMDDSKPGLWDSIKDGASGLVVLEKSWPGRSDGAWQRSGRRLVHLSAESPTDQELASLSGMKEDEFNRAVSLKHAPTNKVADVNHFQGWSNHCGVNSNGGIGGEGAGAQLGAAGRNSEPADNPQEEMAETGASAGKSASGSWNGEEKCCRRQRSWLLKRCIRRRISGAGGTACRCAGSAGRYGGYRCQCDARIDG